MDNVLVVKANVQKFYKQHHIMKTGLSKAFDCMGRQKIPDIFEQEKLCDDDTTVLHTY